MVIHGFIKFKFNIAITPLPSGRNRKKRKKKKKKEKVQKIKKNNKKINTKNLFVSRLQKSNHLYVFVYTYTLQNNNIQNYTIFQMGQAQD